MTVVLAAGMWWLCVLGVAEIRVLSCLLMLSTHDPLMCLRTPIFIGDQAIRSSIKPRLLV